MDNVLHNLNLLIGVKYKVLSGPDYTPFSPDFHLLIRIYALNHKKPPPRPEAVFNLGGALER